MAGVARGEGKLLAQGANAAGGTPEDFARHIAAETSKWQKVVKESGAKNRLSVTAAKRRHDMKTT